MARRFIVLARVTMGALRGLTELKARAACEWQRDKRTGTQETGTKKPPEGGLSLNRHPKAPARHFWIRSCA